MSILFFESFNTQNTDNTPYLDPQYWSKPFDINNPQVSFETTESVLPGNIQTDVIRYGTDGQLRISGYRLDTSPPQFATPLQLSGISGLDSDQLYFSFRIKGLTYNDTYNGIFPYTNKLFTMCNGDNEILSFDVVATTGLSIQGGSSQWSDQNKGIGLSVKQSGVEIGLFDLRVGDISRYYISNPVTVTTHEPMGIVHEYPAAVRSRWTHLEFLIDRISSVVNIRLEGFDVYNSLTTYPYNFNASGQNIEIFDNVKFYNRGVKYDTGSINPYIYDLGTNRGCISLDDLAICNNSGYAPNIWMGPKTRIYLLKQYPESQASIGKQEWTNIGNNIPLFDRNGDSTYVFSEESGSVNSSKLSFFYLVPGFGVYGALDSSNFNSFISNGIGGIKIYNDVRKTYLDSKFVNVYATGDPSISGNYTTLGSEITVNSTAYTLKNLFVFNNPETNNPWTSGNFFSFLGTRPYTSGFFGIKKL